MKAAFIILLVMIVAWRWRSWRNAVKPPPPATDLVACSQCGIQVPQGEVVVGRRGSYCCAAHKSSMEPH